MQETLDAFGVSEVTAPTWIPDSYALIEISVTDIEEFDIFTLSANYESSGGEYLDIDITRYTDEPNVQVEKSDAPVEIFDTNGVTFSLIENNVNYTLEWVTEHYECFIFGSNPDILREMANSIFE